MLQMFQVLDDPVGTIMPLQIVKIGWHRQDDVYELAVEMYNCHRQPTSRIKKENRAESFVPHLHQAQCLCNCHATQHLF